MISIKQIWRLVFAAGVSAMILALLLHLFGTGIDDNTRPTLLELLRNTVTSGLLGYFACNLVALCLRAMRYRLLIMAAAEPNTPSFTHMAAVTGVRNMMVDILPARLGELAYIALLNRGYRVAAGSCLSSLSIAVVFDFVALACIILASGMILVFSGGAAVWLWVALAVVLCIVAIGVAGLVFILPRMTHFLSRLQLQNRFFKSIVSLGQQFSDAIVASRSAGIMTRLLFLSLAIRLIKYGSLFLLFTAVATPAFPVLANAPWEKVLAALVGAELSASLPIPALMSFGTYEAGGTLTLAALGFSKADSLLVLLGVHIWSQAIDYGIGLLSFILIILFAGAATKPAVSAQTANRLKAFAAVCILLVGSGLLALQYRSNLKLGASTAPPVGESHRVDHAADIKAGLSALTNQGVNGFIVWSSNRFGNHDILRMELPSGEIRQLTRHPHTETWPRISPDGRQLVFARSREPWVSQRNAVAWDVMVMDIESGDLKRIAETASYPFWVHDGVVGFLSGGTHIVQHDLATNRQQTLFTPGDGNAMPANAAMSSPDINPHTSEVVFTSRQSALNMNTGFWGTGLQRRNGDIQGVFEGCELNWSNDGQTLYQVGHGGKQKTMFYQVDPNTLQAEPLLDLSGEFSHEYWPEDSNDGRYLVFGASRGDHEHDTADYEIFVWEIGRPENEAVRLTFHSGNDNWPDIFIK